MSFKSHLFICTNAPDKEGKCGSKNSEAMRRALKEKCAQQSWCKEVRINSSGCLGYCEKGIAAVLYPQGKWFVELTDQDGEKLFEEVRKSVSQP